MNDTRRDATYALCGLLDDVMAGKIPDMTRRVDALVGLLLGEEPVPAIIEVAACCAANEVNPGWHCRVHGHEHMRANGSRVWCYHDAHAAEVVDAILLQQAKALLRSFMVSDPGQYSAALRARAAATATWLADNP